MRPQTPPLELMLPLTFLLGALARCAFSELVDEILKTRNPLHSEGLPVSEMHLACIVHKALSVVSSVRNIEGMRNSPLCICDLS